MKCSTERSIRGLCTDIELPIYQPVWDKFVLRGLHTAFAALTVRQRTEMLVAHKSMSANQPVSLQQRKLKEGKLSALILKHSLRDPPLRTGHSYTCQRILMYSRRPIAFRVLSGAFHQNRHKEPVPSVIFLFTSRKPIQHSLTGKRGLTRKVLATRRL